MEEPQIDALSAAVEGGDLHLIYRIEGRPHEVDIFELSRVLESLGVVLKEGHRQFHPETELSLRVQPFQPGSFIMDIAMQAQQNPEVGSLFALMATQPDLLKQVKEVLEYLGLIKKAGSVGASLMDLLKKLKNGKPEKVEKVGDKFEYTAADGGSITVSAPVSNLYNNGTVNQYIFNIVAPVERPEVTGVKTFLKNLERDTGVEITKDDAPAIRAYTAPDLDTDPPKIARSEQEYFLHPKSGSYGKETTISFSIAGESGTIKAKITDPDFLTQYTDGSIRFYQQDLLHALVRKEQKAEGTKVKTKNEITKVIEYKQAHPSQRR